MKTPRLLIEKLPESEAKSLESYVGTVFSKKQDFGLLKEESEHIAFLDDGRLLIDRGYMGMPEIQSAIMKIYDSTEVLDGFPDEISGIYLADGKLVDKINSL